MRKSLIVCTILATSFAGLTTMAELPLSLQKEGQAAVNRGLAWLKAQQHADGHFSSDQWPALTALPLWAMSLSPARDSDEAQKAAKWIASKAREDGSIFVSPEEEKKGGGKPNYNTAISMVALHLSGNDAYRPLVLKARKYVAAGQHLGGDVYRGGFGYDAATKRAYADLSNTYVSMEALAMTESAEDAAAGDSAAKVDKKAVEEFVSSIQNRKESNKAEWVSETPENKGGFAYHPEESKAGTIKSEDGKVYFRSFGSMTYAGVLSLIYADVDRKDPRVRSAIDWATRHWTLDENPGMGAQGLYYFYNVLAKCLDVYGHDELKSEKGETIKWREELVTKLVSLQKIDKDGNGYWQNEENRFWENDAVLVTAYTLIALQLALGDEATE